jgi:hypothetical protein
MNEMGFKIYSMFGDKTGILIQVEKKPEEKRQPFLRKQLAEVLR